MTAIQQQDITIRKATLDDVQTLHDLINLAYKDNHWYRQDHIKNRTNLENIEAQLHRRDSIFMVASTKKQIAGCIQISQCDKDVFELSFLAVHPDCQGKGLAKMMVQSAKQYACQVTTGQNGTLFLRVLVVNIMTNLVSMYKKWGFQSIGTKSWEHLGHSTKDDFRYPCHLIVMEKQICYN